MKRIKIYLSLLSLIALVGCSSLKVVEYDIEYAPNIQLADSTQITVVYNLKNLSKECNETVFKVPANIGELIYSSMVDKVRTIYHNDSVKEYIMSNPTASRLSKSQIADMNIEAENDNVISVNRVTIDPYYRKGTIDEDWHVVDMFIPAELHISVSTPRADSLISYTCVDTLIYNGAGYTQQEAIESLPEQEECLEELVESISSVVSAQYLLRSEKVARLYFVSSNRMMSKANDYWREGMYDEASYLWQYVYENKKSKSLQAKAAANLALYEELNLNYERALMWARISFALCSRKKSVYDPEIAYLSDYIQQLRLDQREQQYKTKNSVYKFE